jgi:hypothetical protein
LSSSETCPKGKLAVTVIAILTELHKYREGRGGKLYAIKAKHSLSISRTKSGSYRKAILILKIPYSLLHNLLSATPFRIYMLRNIPEKGHLQNAMTVAKHGEEIKEIKARKKKKEN